MNVPPEAAAGLTRGEKLELLRRIQMERISRVRTVPASFAQERLWFLHRLEPGSATYNLPEARRLRGPLDVAALERGLGEVVRRHEALRTTFAGAGGAPVQVIAPFGGFALPVEDLGALPEAEREAAAHRLAAEDAARPFDLEAGPLFRASLLRLAADDHVLLLCAHHAVSDAWSQEVVFRELAALYAAFREGRPSPLPELAAQYADAVARQRARMEGEALEREVAWWKERLSGAPALLELPTDRPRPPVRSGRGARVAFSLRPGLRPRLEAVARADDATLYMVLLAAFQVLLGRYARTGDVLVGTSAAGRATREEEALVGFFVNTLVVRADLSGAPTFREALRRTRAETLDVFRHAEVPFERLVAELRPERSLGHNPLFQAFFALHDEPGAPPPLGEAAVEGFGAERGIAKFDLLLHLTRGPEGLRGALEYATDLFDAATVERMAAHLEVLLEAVAADPERPLPSLPIVTGGERETIARWAGEGASFPVTGALHRRFETRAAARPGDVAVSCEGQSLTYGELNARANRLARRLRALGAGPESRVGLCAERSLDLVVGVLAIVKAGAAYVPLDPAYPADRLAFMAEDSGIRVLLAQSALRDPVSVDGVEVLALEDVPADELPEDLGVAVSADNLAYVIYTSGSTGRPKGVGVTHGNVLRLFDSTQSSFAFSERDAWTLFHSYAFDFSVWEIWGALLHGGRLVIVPWTVSRDPSAFRELLRRERVTVLNQTPSAFRALCEVDEREAEPLTALRMVVFGGEALNYEALRGWLDRYGPKRPRLVNMYGITETTVHVTWHTVTGAELRQAGAGSGVGTAIPDLRAYVLDAAGNPCPIGIPGELHVGGAGLARGYLGRPSLTAQRFIPDPFSGEAGARLYRSGDLARWKADGTLEYLGRIDQQVKVRGFRIELGEIESTLLAHPAVASAAVIVRGEGEAAALVAYVVPNGEMPSAGELRDALKKHLPEYMVPAAFVAMERIPLTTNGKLDRGALPEPEAAGSSADDRYLAPRTPVEEVVAGIWAEVLGARRVGATDDFFALGGHSLLATRVMARVGEVFGVEAPLRALFEASTVASLAARVEALRRAGAPRLPAVVPVGRERALPLSFAQERLWFLDRLRPEDALYNTLAAPRLDGVLDHGALERALGEIVRRHEALRTVFREEGGAPVQVVVPFGGFSLPVVDLTALGEGEREAEARRLAAEEGARPFDLGAGPVFRATLLRLGGEAHLLLLCMHHVASDGWSMDLLFRELAALYGAFREGGASPLAELPVQYADHAVWQREQLRGEALERPLAYWRARLAGAPALLELPADRARPAERTFRGAREPVSVPAEVLEGLRALARREGATLYMVLLGAFQALLARYAGSDDVVVGSPVAGRTRAEVEGLIGFFVNTLALRTDLSGDPAFAELLRRVRAVTLDAWEHQELPFERLVAELQPERSLSHSPLFQVMFTLRDGDGAAWELPGVRTELLEIDSGTTKFDLTLALSAHGGELRGELAYATDLFERDTVARMAGHLARVLEQVAADPGARLSRLELLGEAERARVASWSRSGDGYALDGCVHEIFERQAAATPEATALVFRGERVTYAELNARANRLARHLVRRGVRLESRVGVCVERSPGMVVAILAALKAGGAYVPLDPQYPGDRLEYMLADAGVEILVSQSSLVDHLPIGREVVALDRAAAEIAKEDASNLGVEVGIDNLLYVIYTSGSTGKPKGTEVPHRAVPGFFPAVDPAGPGARTVFLQHSSTSWDALTLELWPSILTGGASVLFDGTSATPEQLGEAVRENGVNTLWLSAAFFNTLVDSADGALEGVRRVMVGGEKVSAEHARAARRRYPSLELVNGYGPSECTVFASAQEIGALDDDATAISIGRPVGDRRVHVLDAMLNPVPAGVPGELFVGGPAVARGYLGRPGMTADRFVPDAFGEPGARLYRSGDRVRWRADGTLEYLGRLDAQVKVRGFRVELGEIEAALRQHAGVRECGVVARADVGGGTRLVAYVVGDATAGALRAHLRESLPDYMVPAAFVSLDALPLTAHGKLDRRALPEPGLGADAERYVAPRTPLEEVLAEVWAEVLGLERVGVDESFFELGGHSLLATLVMARVRELCGPMPLRALFEGPTVAELAGRVEAARRAGQPLLPPVAPVERGRPLPLSFGQERLWFLDRMEPESAFYNVFLATRLEGPLDAAALERALGGVVRRHEALRTLFREADGVPAQVVEPFSGFALPVDDLSALPAEARDDAALRRAREEAARPFDLAAGPLFRARLLRLGAEEHVLVVCTHHVASDGWSMGVLFRDLKALYAAERDGAAPPLAPLPVQYPDFAVWQRERLRDEVLEGELDWWRARLAGAPALLELPTDRPRPAVQRFRGARESFRLPPAALEGLRAAGRAEGATLYMVLLAAFQALLARYTGSDDVVVGTPVAGRTRREVEGLVGFFVNTLVLRADLSGNPTFREAVRRVREVTLDAYDHQEVPFERLVEALRPERSPDHTPLFQVMFILNNTDPVGAGLPGLAARSVGVELDIAKFDLTLAFTADDEGLLGTLEYATDLFERGTALRMMEQLARVLAQVAADAGRPLSELALMDAAERARVAEWNATEAPYPADRCIHQLFAEQAARTPDAAAVVFGGEALAYRELEARANRVASHLLRLGVGPEVRVGICLERGPELLPAILGVMKAGGAYVPVDPAHPAERTGYVLADAGVAVLLTQERLRGRVPAPAGVPVLALDTAWPRIAAEPAEAPETGVTPESLAYVIYTSGSTGRPKGVAMHHRGVCNYIDWGIRHYGAAEGNGAPVFSSMAVDLTITNLLPLFAGKPVHLLPEESPVEALAEAMRTRPDFGLVKITPTHLSLLTPLLTAEEARGAARTLVIGADFLPAEPTVWWQDHAPGVRLMNEYGPTETVVGCSAYLLPGGVHREGPVPVGGPIRNLSFHVLDAHLQPVPVRLPGELYIGGAGVARGYLGRPGLSAEKFVPDPFAGGGARMYRTGDRARWLEGGSLTILGRTDNQVKIRGYRVELGEIEAVLRRHPAVSGAIAVVREDRPGDRRLVAYVAAPGADPPALRDYARRSLPEYMVPGAFVILDALPETATGKIDPKTLPAPEYAAAGPSPAPRTALESRVAAVWREVLGRPEVGVHDNFFDLGGTSLLLYRVYTRLREERAGLRVVDLFRYPTVEALAAHLGDGDAGSAAGLAEGRARAEERRASRRRVRSG